MSSQLKPCPHCGDTDLNECTSLSGERSFISCLQCGLSGPRVINRYVARDAWNGLPRSVPIMPKGADCGECQEWMRNLLMYFVSKSIRMSFDGWWKTPDGKSFLTKKEAIQYLVDSAEKEMGKKAVEKLRKEIDSATKPCPHCGSTEIEVFVCTFNDDDDPKPKYCHALCLNRSCSLSGPLAATREGAIEVWNALPR